MPRLDVLLVEGGAVTSRARAQKLIAAGQVSVAVGGQWKVITKASQSFDASTATHVELGEDDRFVSRGGLKLAGALEKTGLSLQGFTVIDVGQSTGGFTDCALQFGAAKVVGIEVGHNQLVPQLRADPRVVCIEGMNAREMTASLKEHTTDQLGFDAAVMDVSFISQTKILPSLIPLLKEDGHLISLVKPQFEVGSANIGKGGIVKNASLYPALETSICTLVKSLGMVVTGYFDSPIAGGDGNREFLLYAVKSSQQ